MPVSRCSRDLGGAAQPGQLTQTGLKDAPYHRMSCSVYKLEGICQKTQITAWGQAGNQSAGGKQLFCVSLVPLTYSITYSFLTTTTTIIITIIFLLI